MPICIICDEREVSARSRYQSCQVCRGNMGGWLKRGFGAIIDYQKKLRIREARMDLIVDIDDPPVQLKDPPKFTAAQKRKLVKWKA